MNKFTDGFQFGIAGDFFLEEVFNRLDVMVGGPLDILDALCVLFTEFFNNVVEYLLGMSTECGNFRMLSCAASACNQRTSTTTR